MVADRERLDWLDAARGLGILLVVAGHVWLKGPVRDSIYAFHMPLFFLLSGYGASARPIGVFLKKSWTSLFIPYLLFLALLMSADFLIEHLRGYRPYYRDWHNALRAALIGGSELRGPLTIFWFVPCLAAARVVQNAGMTWLNDARDWRWLILVVPALLFGLWIGSKTDFSPLGLIAAPVAFVFLWLGSVWRQGGLRPAMLFVAAVVTALMLLSGPLPPLNMKAGDYGVPLISLAAALAMSLGLCWVAWAAPLTLFTALGRMSLVIMFLHVAVIHYCRPYFGEWTLFVLAVAGPAAIFFVLDRTGWGRRFFLGR